MSTLKPMKALACGDLPHLFQRRKRNATTNRKINPCLSYEKKGSSHLDLPVVSSSCKHLTVSAEWQAEDGIIHSMKLSWTGGESREPHLLITTYKDIDTIICTNDLNMHYSVLHGLMKIAENQPKCCEQSVLN